MTLVRHGKSIVIQFKTSFLEAHTQFRVEMIKKLRDLKSHSHKGAEISRCTNIQRLVIWKIKI